MIIAVLVATVILTLAAITVVHYFLAMPTEATHGGQGTSSTSITSKLPQANPPSTTSPPATSSNPVAGWVRETSTILRDVLGNMTRMLKENSNTGRGSRSLISASLPKRNHR